MGAAVGVAVGVAVGDAVGELVGAVGAIVGEWVGSSSRVVYQVQGTVSKNPIAISLTPSSRLVTVTVWLPALTSYNVVCCPLPPVSVTHCSP